jgi:hypothetical protein
MIFMVQTYQGYFQEGRFVSPQVKAIPEQVEVYVLVTNNSIPARKTKAQEQREAFESFVQACAEAEPLGDKFDEIIKEGVHVRGELQL